MGGIRRPLVVARDARVERVPDAALTLPPNAADAWVDLWDLPVATLWDRSDVPALTRLVLLQRSPQTFQTPGLLAEMRHLEDRFLLSPRARLEAGVELVDEINDGDGPVLVATRQAVADADLPSRFAGAVAVLLDLAALIDAQVDGVGPSGKLDNVSVPTFLRYCEQLGLTPAGMEKLGLRQEEPDGKLAELEARARRRRIRSA